MTEVTALFFEGELRALLQPGHFGIPLHFFRTIDSTNDFAKKIAGRGGPEGTLVVSEEQTAGRGSGCLFSSGRRSFLLRPR